MSLSRQLSEYIAACFTGLWIQSHEHDDALAEIAQLCQRESWRLATWDIAQGLRIPGQDPATTADTGGSDPLSAIHAVSALATPDSSAILVLVNFHRFLGSPEIVQALARQISQGKHNRAFIVILSPIVDIPTELDKLFVVVDHELPGREQLAEIARGIATEEAELPSGDDLTMVLDAAAGLTRFEAEGAFSLSLVRDGQLKPRSIWELKSQMLKKSGLLSLYHGHESFSDLGGLDNLKSFCTRAMRRQQDNNPLKRPRGVMLLVASGLRQVPVRQDSGQRNRPAHAHSGCRRTDGQPRGTNRVQHSTGLANRGCHGALCVDGRRSGQGTQWCGQLGADRLRCLSSPLWHLPDLAQRSRQRRVCGHDRQRHRQTATRIRAGGKV